MSKKIKIGNLNVKLNLWHYWSSGPDRWLHFRAHHLGLYYKKTISIGSGKKGAKLFDDDNHVTTHSFGIELIWIKMSMSLTFGNIMLFEINK
jgi:hypothetical protein